ncbi:MAG: thiol reductase thioredoxin [Candidatus Krumholzibacteria bacterium]|nr:thiol reductase thioredoxin [Candidatus Krumholzibacteria bacterium]
MGFIKRLLGLETKPGEPKPVNEGSFESEVLNCDLPCFVDFYSLWCPACQVMSGLLNEVGPEYIEKAEFFKLNVINNPTAPVPYKISGVPTIIAFKNGKPVDRLVGLAPIDELKSWIDKHI